MQKQNEIGTTSSSRSAVRCPKSASPAKSASRRLELDQPVDRPRDPHPKQPHASVGGADAQPISPDEARRIVDKIEF